MDLPEINLLLEKACGSQYDMVWSSLKIYPTSSRSSPPPRSKSLGLHTVRVQPLLSDLNPRILPGEGSVAFPPVPATAMRDGGRGPTTSRRRLAPLGSERLVPPDYEACRRPAQGHRTFATGPARAPHLVLEAEGRQGGPAHPARLLRCRPSPNRTVSELPPRTSNLSGRSPKM